MYPLKLNFWLFLFQCAELSPSSKTFQMSIDDSENISNCENFEATSAPKEKGKSPKGLCFTNEPTELGIVQVSSYWLNLAVWWRVYYRFLSFYFIPKENTQRASWSVKEKKCWS